MFDYNFEYSINGLTFEVYSFITATRRCFFNNLLQVDPMLKAATRFFYNLRDY
jgi:hypothetical protein